MPTFVFSINRDESVDPHCHPESNESICCVISRAAVACARLTLCPANCEAQAKRRWGRDGGDGIRGPSKGCGANSSSTTEARPEQQNTDR